MVFPEDTFFPSYININRISRLLICRERAAAWSIRPHKNQRPSRVHGDFTAPRCALAGRSPCAAGDLPVPTWDRPLTGLHQPLEHRSLSSAFCLWRVSGLQGLPSWGRILPFKRWVQYVKQRAAACSSFLRFHRVPPKVTDPDFEQEDLGQHWQVTLLLRYTQNMNFAAFDVKIPFARRKKLQNCPGVNINSNTTGEMFP